MKNKKTQNYINVFTSRKTGQKILKNATEHTKKNK